MIMRRSLPTATYRLQFNKDFTFVDAARLVPYLHELGISHCYASPLLKARRGSSHGYDIVDHHALNPELGGRRDFENFITVLRNHDMGLILDIVPNHMGIGGSDNRWWLDVLENGRASRFAHYFDIDWEPASGFLINKVLLPILGDQYGVILDRGEIRLSYDDMAGGFYASYYEHILPVDPKTYPEILTGVSNVLSREQGPDSELNQTLQLLISRCRSMVPKKKINPERKVLRWETAAEIKAELQIFFSRPAEKSALAEVLSVFNGGRRQNRYDPLHQLLEKQAYRLAFWRVAADDINYRRFFNINSLAGIRMECREVFAATHAFIFELIAADKIQGLRIDHPDGLYHPNEYLRRLRQTVENHAPGDGKNFYLVVEKILAADEKLPALWPVHGTTGYEFGALVNGLFVRPESRKLIGSLYHRFISRAVDFDSLLYNSKKFIMKVQLSSELTVLTSLFKHIAEMSRHTRDFTFNGLRDAIVEVVACLPVYRTYISPERLTNSDRRIINEAVMLATKKSRAADISIYDFVGRALLPTERQESNAGIFRLTMQFAMKFQQYTAAVMPKALEDTVFYVYNRLISLNEVGSDPRRFNTDMQRFHRDNEYRLQNWPGAMLSTSTHDTKRSEDVRARINVISEIPHEWGKRVSSWRGINRRHRVKLPAGWAPSRNDEYHFYQTLVGTWPLDPATAADMEQYHERLQNYMLKAVKEAKEHTSWIKPSEDYEDAVAGFVKKTLDRTKTNPFLDDFLPFVKRIGGFGLLNSLSATLLKLASPGIPDIYQGNELWNFSMVDPDNRRPVDFPAYRRKFTDLQRRMRDSSDGRQQLHDLMGSLDDGSLKMLVTWKVLVCRKQNPELFHQGSYFPLEVQGAGRDYLCAFARVSGGRQVIVMAARFHSGLASGGHDPFIKPAGASIWKDTRILLPNVERQPLYENIFSSQNHYPTRDGRDFYLNVAEILNPCPMALLIGCNDDLS